MFFARTRCWWLLWVSAVACVPAEKRSEQDASISPRGLSPCPLSDSDARRFLTAPPRVRSSVTAEQCGYDGADGEWVVVTVLRKSAYELQRDRSTRLEMARRIRDTPETYLAETTALGSNVADVFAYSGAFMISVASSTRTRVAREIPLRVLDSALSMYDAGPPAGVPAASAAAPPPDAGGARSWRKVRSGKGPLGELVAEALASKSSREKAVVYVGARWCPPCRAIERFKNDARMVEALRGSFVVELDVDDWTPTELHVLGYDTRVIPVFIAVDAKARAKGPRIDGGAWGEDSPDNMARALKKFVRSLE